VPKVLNSSVIFNFFPLISTLVAMIISQSTKLIIFSIKRNYTFKLSSLISAGGMPSTHSALMTCIAVSIGLKEGLHSTEFFLATILSLVVIYDARGIRHCVGEQAKVINQHVLQSNQSKVNEFVGHTLAEVVVGILVGLFTAISMYKIFIS
jgi:acid phosphatase family membrane protein YuiD